MEKIVGLKRGKYKEIAESLNVSRLTVAKACNGETDTELARLIRKEAVLRGGIRIRPKNLKYKVCEE